MEDDYERFPGRIKKDIKLDYLDRNPTKYQQFLNKAPVKEKPSFVEQTKNLAGSIFNTSLQEHNLLQLRRYLEQ